MSNKEIYPLKFNEIFKEKIWGGRRLESFLGKKLPKDKSIGESWELVDHREDISVVRNGKYRDDNLKSLIKNFEKELVGKDVKLSRSNRFPLLFKYIDASKKLSIQVHPDDEYAYLNEIDETGKTEAWYVVWAKPGAQLVCGLKEHMSKRGFKKVIESKKIGDYLDYINIYKGDLIFVPPGTIHTIMGGVLLAEIQQNSDATYRIFDWDRVDRHGKSRELHIDKALDVIDFSLVRNYKVQPLSINIDRNVINYLVVCEKFAVELCEIFDEYKLDCDGSKFYILSFIEGNGEIFYGNESDINLNTKTLDIKKGETILLPALLGKTTIKTDSKLKDDKLKFLKFYVPNITKDIIKPLTDEGFTKQDIISLGGWNKVNDVMKYF
ncbi:MAG: type I phosphomannose isomerase catalytic subunit [Candidatus Humimicrobiia bacterium]